MITVTYKVSNKNMAAVQTKVFDNEDQFAQWFATSNCIVITKEYEGASSASKLNSIFGC